MRKCCERESHFFKTALFTIFLTLLFATGALAQVNVAITTGTSENYPVVFTIEFTYDDGYDTPAIVDPLKSVISLVWESTAPNVGGDDGYKFALFPSGEFCELGDAYIDTSGGSEWIVYVRPAIDCSVYLRIDADGVSTYDDPPQTNAEEVVGPTVDYISPPFVHVEPVSSDPTNSPTVVFKAEFSRPVDGFGTGDIEIEPVGAGTAGGAKTAVVTGSGEPGDGGSVFYIGVSGMTYPGRVQISIPQGAAQSNGKDNWNSVDLGCGTYEVQYDGGAPSSISLTTPAESGGLVVTGTYTASYETDKAILDIAGTASDAVGVDLVTWSNDRGGSGNCTGTTIWSQNGIYLRPGQNIITITAYDAAGNSLSYILTVDCTNDVWVETGDASSSDLGKYTSLALDGSGYPRISYYDVAMGYLKYATWNGIQWTTQPVDGAQTSTAADVGQHTSIELDPSTDDPRISYYDVINTDLKYAYLKNGVWKYSIVDGASGINDDVGKFSSLVLDSLGKARIAYYDVANGDLLYAEGSAADNPTWTIISVDTGGDVGQYVSLALDSTGKPRISYYDATNGNLKYAEGDAATDPNFTVTTVDSGANVGQYSSLVLDSEGKPRISYYDSTTGDLKYAEGDAATNPTWTRSTVDSTDDVGQYCSLALDSNDKPRISYYDATRGNLKYVEGDASASPTWGTPTILDDGLADADNTGGAGSYDVGQYCSLAIDATNDSPHVSYYDATSMTLRYIFAVSGSAGSSPTCIVTAPSSPTKVSPIDFTITFSEAVTGFDASDAVVTGGVKGALSTLSSSQYSLSVVPLGDGVVTCSIPFGAAHGATALDNLSSNTATVTFDGNGPAVAVDQMYAQPDPTNALPIHFSIVFSEPVSGFTGEDVVISGSAGGTKSVILTGNGTHFDAVVYGVTTAGSVIASVAQNVCTDEVGNGNMPGTSTDATVWYDGTAPTCTINQASGLYDGPTQDDPTKDTSINFTAVFSEPVVAFSGTWTSDVGIDNKLTITGTASFCDKDGNNTKTAVITPIGTPDVFGHYSTYNVAVSGMTSGGTVIAKIPAQAASDCDNNGTAINLSTASTSTDNSVVYDETNPTVTINQKAGQADPTSVPPILFEVIFSKDVYGFDSTDVEISGTAVGTITKVVTGGPRTYTVEVSGMQHPEGETGLVSVIATVSADVAFDAAGNGNLVATSDDNTVWFAYDGTGPVATIVQEIAEVDEPATELPIKFLVVFDEAVQDFSASEVELSGTAGSGDVEVNNVSELAYEVLVDSLAHSGTVIIDVPAGSVYDLVGNENGESVVSYEGSDEVFYDDQTNPTVTVDQADGQADPTNSLPISFVAVFSEPVTGFDADDVLVTSGGTLVATVTEVAPNDGTTYEISVSGSMTSGTVTVDIVDGAAVDLSGNNFSVASTSTDNEVTYDSDVPTVEIVPADGQDNPASTSPVNFTAVFSEPVYGFDGADVILTGTALPASAVVTEIAPNDGTTYNIAVSGMMRSGSVAVSIGAAAATDAAGNPNPTATTLVTILYDWPGPSVTIDQASTQADPTNASTVNFTVVFSNSVTDFTGSDVVLSGTAGATTASVSGSGATYNVAVSGMTGPGTIIVSIPENVALDDSEHGNANSTSTDNQVTFDNVAPTVTVEQAATQDDPTADSTINFTIGFSEVVSGFTASDITVVSSVGDTLSKSLSEIVAGTTYNVAITGMTAEGTVTASVASGSAQDLAGNYNTASTSNDASVLYNREPLTPTISLADGQTDPTNASTINLEVVFSVSVSDFASEDVTLGGTASPTTAVVTGSDATYNVAISGMSTVGTVTASLAADVVHNEYDDGNTAASISLAFDDVAPEITITGPTSDDDCLRNCRTLNLSGTASDNVELASVKWTNIAGSSGNCTGTTSWSASGLSISGDSDTITVTATDTAGNTATDSIVVDVLLKQPGDEWSNLAMVSLPIIPDETDPKLEVGFYSDSWVIFDTSANDYVKYPDSLTWFVPAEETPGRGFWTRFGSTYINPCGIIPPQDQDAVIHLEPGWNLIGNPFVSSVAWDFDQIEIDYHGIRVELGDAIGLVGEYAWGWNSVDEEYYLIYDTTVIPDATGNLAPWQAYWVKAELECDLILPAP